jgi:hypothetical protein
MKRYMCRKTIALSFTAGKVYQVYMPSPGYEKILDSSKCFIDDMNDIDEISPETLASHFTELSDDLPIPRDEADQEPFTTPETRRKLTAGWAWFIVLMTTLTAIILSEIL